MGFGFGFISSQVFPRLLTSEKIWNYHLQHTCAPTYIHIPKLLMFVHCYTAAYEQYTYSICQQTGRQTDTHTHNVTLHSACEQNDLHIPIVCVHLSLHVSICLHVYMCVHAYTCIHIEGRHMHTSVRLHICLSASSYVYTLGCLWHLRNTCLAACLPTFFGTRTQPGQARILV